MPLMSDEDPLDWLLPILERRSYAADMRDQGGVAAKAAIANLPIGWVFEDPTRHPDDPILRATDPMATRSRSRLGRPSTHGEP